MGGGGGGGVGCGRDAVKNRPVARAHVRGGPVPTDASGSAVGATTTGAAVGRFATLLMKFECGTFGVAGASLAMNPRPVKERERARAHTHNTQTHTRSSKRQSINSEGAAVVTTPAGASNTGTKRQLPAPLSRSVGRRAPVVEKGSGLPALKEPDRVNSGVSFEVGVLGLLQMWQESAGGGEGGAAGEHRGTRTHAGSAP